jgi:hypothetical protein
MSLLCTENADVKAHATLYNPAASLNILLACKRRPGILSHQRIEVSWAELKSRTPEIMTSSKVNARCLNELHWPLVRAFKRGQRETHESNDCGNTESESGDTLDGGSASGIGDGRAGSSWRRDNAG